MGIVIPTREQAFELLLKYTKNDRLVKHGLSVEAAMRHFAELNNEDAEKWGIIGLVHDLDYDMYPDEHCKMTRKILEENNWPEEYIRAIESHGWKHCTDVEPKERMEIILYTIDELTGLIMATALLRPSKSVLDLEVKSVQKKWNQKGFAAGVDRAIIEEGAQMLVMPIEKVIEETINGMRKAAEAIGLKGEL